ncbi:MAG TPA: hypothetical protein VHE35_13290 [Kofleriaceae bacterium]|nr:hypothetical protein [Kofleriaceae bacterium]
MDRRREQAGELMARFAERTGLTSPRPPRRYLWTDAFAVCNFVALGEDELALRLVERVHAILGRHRGDDGREGWLSGESEQAGEAHPTRGGLRIGKPLPERRADEPAHSQLEWERDGQYFHYLTKWMHALAVVARASGQDAFRAWARELAFVAHRAFVYGGGTGARRMYWKMSIDLSRPQVRSMGQHDPLDGLLTCSELGMLGEAADFASMVDEHELATADPLGIGGLLVDAYRAEQLGITSLPGRLVAAAAAGLRAWLDDHEGGGRLAFRELGLAIGLAAAERLTTAALLGHATLRAELEAEWLRPERRADPRYREHEDINDVMLATSLVPDGFLQT